MTRKAAAADGKGGLTRERPIGTLENTGVLVVDVQEHFTVPGFGEHADVEPDNIPEDLAYYFDRMKETVIPNIARLQAAARAAGVEVLFTVIESLTSDGRDRSLDYKIMDLHIPPGSRSAKVPEEIAPRGDEIVLPKTSSSVFNSTNIDYVLRNLEIDYLVVAGILTDQCVESAVRDACDRGFLVSVVEDACASVTRERHENALELYKGYGRVTTTDTILAEIGALSGAAAAAE